MSVSEIRGVFANMAKSLPGLLALNLGFSLQAGAKLVTI